MRYAELRKYNSAGTAAQILPNYTELQASGVYNDAGILDFSYPLDAANAAGLADGSEIGLVIDGTEYERYFVENTSTIHASDGTLVREFQGRTTLAYLEDAIVYPQNWPVAVPNGFAFVGATAGTIMRTLMNQAKTLGYLSFIDVSSFTGAATSNGVTWASTLDVTYSTGTTLLQVVLDLVQRGVCDVKMSGRQLLLYNFGFLANHKTVVLRRALNMTEASSTTDSREFASTVLIEGEDAAIQEANDPAAALVVRKRARYVQQGGITDPGTLLLLAQAELSTSKAIKEEITVGISTQDGSPQPWSSFLPGEWLYFDRDAQVEELQCQQISLGVDRDRNFTVGLTVKDRLSDITEKLKRKIDAITGGNSGTYGSLPNNNPVDLLAPAAPSTVNNTLNSYQDANGRAFAQATISWLAVTTNSDGTFADDVAGYEVQYLVNGNWTSAGRVDSSTTVAYASALQPGQSFQSRVRAVDNSGNYSPWTASAVSTLPNDASAPPVPSTPTVNPYLGQMRVFWDGLTNAAGPMPADFNRVDVHMSTASGFTISTATRIGSLNASGAWIATGLTYGQTYFFKLVARDNSNLASAASAQAFGTAVQASDGDIADLGVGKLTAGILSAEVAISGRIATSLSGARVELNSTGMHAFNSAGTETVNISNTGSATFSGAVEGGTLNMPRVSTIGPGRTEISDTDFKITVDGTTNLCVNPSFEVFNPTMFVVNAATTTVAQSRGPLRVDPSGNSENVARFGRYSLKISSTAANGYVDAHMATVQPNTRYRLSFYCAIGMALDTAAPPDGDVGYANFQNIKVLREDNLAVLATSLTEGSVVDGPSKGADINFNPSISTAQALGYPDWTVRWSKDFVTPSTIPTDCNVIIRLPSYVTVAGAAGSTKALHYDGVQLEAKPYVTLYCDGAQDEASWIGDAHNSASTRPTYSPFWFSYSDGLIVQGRMTASDLHVKNTFKKGSGAAQGSNFVQATRSNTGNAVTDTWYTSIFQTVLTTDWKSTDDGEILPNSLNFTSQAPGVYSFTSTINWGLANRTGQRFQRHITAGGTVLAITATDAAVLTTNTLSSLMYLPGYGYYVMAQNMHNGGGTLTQQPHTASLPFIANFAQVA